MTAEHDTTTARDHATSEDPSLSALVELCDAQVTTIRALRQALDGQSRQGSPRAAVQALAHEIATPLTAIIGLLQLVTAGRLTEERSAEYVRRALRQAESLARIVDDLVAVAGDEVPDVRMPAVRVRLAEVVADALEAAWPRLQGRRVEVHVPATLTMITVPGRVQQILVNLLVNAARHSRHGAAVRIAASGDDGYVVLEVADRGPGVDGACVERLFEPFVRGAGTNGGAGLGLGLYLVRRLAESLEGDVVLTPREGGGTVARVVLPQRRSGAASEE